MDFEFNEQEKMIRQAAAEVSQRLVAPRAAEIDRGAYPLDLLQELGRLGYAGLPVPVHYGGSGAGYLSFTLALEQFCQASMSLGAMLSVNLTPVEGVLKFGNEEQKQRFITPVAQGRAFGCIAFTEAETGADPRLISTTARLEGDSYYLNGHKQFIANVAGANLALVFARRTGGEGLNAFIVDTATPGFNVEERLETLGVRGAGTSTAFLDNVKVHRNSLLGQEGQGFDILLEAISVERFYVGIQALGVAQASLQAAVSYAKQRQALGKPISRLLSIQLLLAEMAVQIEGVRWLAYRTAFLRDQGKDIKTESAMVKIQASRAAVEVTRLAMQVTGAYGAMQSMPVERYYRDAKMTEIYVGISEIQKVIVANSLLR
jgi:alkylation response protein AidB-like acyl-CoA dehydrogenase